MRKFRQGCPIPQIARQLGLSQRFVLEICRFQTIEEEREYYARMIMSRISTEEIAQHAQVSVSTVDEWHRRWRKEPTLLPESVREEFLAFDPKKRVRSSALSCSAANAERLLHAVREGLKEAGLPLDAAVGITAKIMLSISRR